MQTLDKPGMKLNSLNNIPKEVLDYLRDTYEKDPKYRISDDREEISFEQKREYFLIEKNWSLESNMKWTFIWIENNLWQFRICNTQCVDKPEEVDPLKILNNLLQGF